MSEFIYRHQKIISIILTLLFVLSLIPMFIIAGFDAAAGDDYNYGAATHLMFVSTGSVWQVIKTAIKATADTWKSWQGTWFDCFMFTLHPEVFSDTGYVIVPYIFITMQIAAFLLFAHHFIKVRLGLGKSNLYWLEIGLIYLLFVFQLVPSQKSAFFWWVGSIHYAMPMCLAMAGLVVADRFLLFHKLKDLIILSIIASLIGGATYPATLLLILGAGLLWISCFIGEKKSQESGKNIFLLIPLVLEMIGLVISAISPGNAIRGAADIKEGAVPSGGVIPTIIKSIIFSVEDAIGFFIAKKIYILIAFIAIGIVSLAAVRHAVCESTSEYKVYKKRFSHPLLFILAMFLLNAAMYAPRLYAGGAVSSGYFNFNFWVFTLCVTGSMIYVMGWVLTLKSEPTAIDRKTVSTAFSIVTNVALILAVLIIAFVGRHGIKSCTDYLCLEYYLSGQAQDYKDQIALQRFLMQEEGVDDVVLPQINNEQGPLMHMPVVEDPNNVDNLMTRSFYGKNSCRSIPRDQWMSEYSDKYNAFITSIPGH